MDKNVKVELCHIVVWAYTTKTYTNIRTTKNISELQFLGKHLRYGWNFECLENSLTKLWRIIFITY
jgi:hypothetical protein